jgi:uncharacterized membrane protein YgdD (TMEM256/DUF423 family)
MGNDRRVMLATGAIAMLVAVAAGAFGAHALRDAAPADRLTTWHTAVEYQAWHALALVALAALADGALDARALRATTLLFALGIVLFSGSLYALTLTGTRAFGYATPVGGTAFLAGWLVLAIAVLRRP